MEVLMSYDFPGNVRELENIIERGVALETSNIILPESLTLSSFRNETSESSQQPQSPFQIVANEEELFERGLEEVMAETEKVFLNAALKSSGNSKMQAADLLRISFRSLRYKVKKYEIG
jgi:two-component system response regulator PilR (NtrC family)